METAEDIAFVLDTVGETLQFSTGTIKAIPLVELIAIENVAQDYIQQSFEFQTSEVEFKKALIQEGMTFFYQHPNSVRKFKFKVTGFNFDMTGWVNLLSSFHGVVNV